MHRKIFISIFLYLAVSILTCELIVMFPGLISYVDLLASFLCFSVASHFNIEKLYSLPPFYVLNCSISSYISRAVGIVNPYAHGEKTLTTRVHFLRTVPFVSSLIYSTNFQSYWSHQFVLLPHSVRLYHVCNTGSWGFFVCVCHIKHFILWFP